MLLLRLWNYIKGYVIILVEGYFLEKFINICTHRQIFLWDIKRQKNCVMTLKISIRGFKMLRPVARKTGCRVKILKKKGLPFIFNRYRKRKAFVLGAVLFVLLIYVLTSFVWAIEISGNKEVETRVLLEKLASLGVKPGVLKYKVDPDKIVNKMILDIEELSWVSVVVKGTKVKVQVAERKKPPQLIPKNIPCHIIAEKDGIIKSIIIKDGQGMVKVGDTVTKGQILVSGAIDIKNEEKKRLVHAIAIVEARTWYEKQWPVSLKLREEIRTGRKKDSYYLKLFTKKIKLFSEKGNFNDYDKIEMEKRISIGKDLVFPFALLVERFYEVNIYENKISLEKAKHIAADSAYKEALKDIPEDAKIVDTSLEFVQNDDGSMIAKVIIECIEDIGVTQKIGGE